MQALGLALIAFLGAVVPVFLSRLAQGSSKDLALIREHVATAEALPQQRKEHAVLDEMLEVLVRRYQRRLLTAEKRRKSFYYIYIWLQVAVWSLLTTMLFFLSPDSENDTWEYADYQALVGIVAGSVALLGLAGQVRKMVALSTVENPGEPEKPGFMETLRIYVKLKREVRKMESRKKA